MMQVTHALLCVVTFLALPGSDQLANAGEMDALGEEHRLSMEFETPHTKWAKPYALGKVKVLYFSISHDTNARDIIELMQRFDIEADAAYWSQICDTTNWVWNGGELGRKRILRLLEKPHDAYIFNRVPLTNLDAEAQYKLLKRVTEGAGLVLIGVDDLRVLKPQHTLNPLPDFLHQDGRPIGNGFTIRSGRGFQIAPRPTIPYRPGWEVEYDLWVERVGRALLWASGREPALHIEATISPGLLDRKLLPSKSIQVQWMRTASTLPVPKKSSFHLRVRREDGMPLMEEQQQRDSASDGLICAMARLPAGRYWLDVLARSRRGIEGWDVAKFEVKSSRSVAAVELARDWGEVGETIEGTATFIGQPDAAETAEIRLRDRRGRILARSIHPSPKDKIVFRFPIESWMPMLLRVEATLLDADGEVASASRFSRVTKRHRGQFNFLVWDYPRAGINAYGEESLAHLGMTLHLGGGTPTLEHAAYDIAWVPYTTRIIAPHGEDGIMQPACWNDLPNIQEHIRKIVKPHQASRQHGVFAYSLGDETVTRGSCVHPSCLEAYRAYLKQEYGALEALNASWGTAFKDWAEVGVTQEKDFEEKAAKREKNYPRWYDRQAFQCANFIQFCKKFGDAYQLIDPQAKTGFEGAGRFAEGDDLDLILRTNGFWSPYPGTADEVVRSLAPKDFPHANWMGYTQDAETLLSKYWRMVTRGCDSVWWWRWDSYPPYRGLLAPDLSPYAATKDMAEDTRIVRDGLGTLLQRSEMLDDGIAILYSHPSAYAAKVETGPSFGDYESNHRAWHLTLWDIGLQFRYVTDRMLRNGEFDAKRFKILILPQTEAIGPKEAEVIRQYVEGGGVVIADVRPGIYDGHNKAVDAGALDGLFGIKRTQRSAAALLKASLRCPVQSPNSPASFEWDPARVDQGIQLAGGDTHGEAAGTPLFITHKVGQGKAILLNFSMMSFPVLAAAETKAEAAFVVRHLLGMGNAKPMIQIKTPQGERSRNLQTVRWQDGQIQLVALFREAGHKEDVRVVLPQAVHAYDLRQRRYLGKKREFDTTILPCRATFFALLPEKPKPVRASIAEPTSTGSRVMKLSLSVPNAAGLHAFRLHATTPAGQPADWIDHVAIVGAEKMSVDLPMAFNDPAGRWKLQMIDLFTERAETVEFKLR